MKLVPTKTIFKSPGDQGIVILQWIYMIKSQLKAEIGQVSAYVGSSLNIWQLYMTVKINDIIFF